MSTTLDRRDGAIRTRHRPASPTAPYQPELEKGQAGGYASLGETDARVPTAQLGSGTAAAGKALMGDQSWADVATQVELDAEAATRASADTTLQTNITAEATTRASAVSAEASARATADALLQPKSEKNQASGYPGLDGSSKLTGSQQVYGSAANTACQGNDSRLSDSRAPTGTAGGDCGGTYPNPTVTSGANHTHSTAQLTDYTPPGSFTPGLTIGGSATGITFSVQSGRYVQVGKLVTATINVVLSSKGAGSGSVLITGLPVTPEGFANAAIGFCSPLNSALTLAFLANAGTSITLRKANATGMTNLLDTDIQNTTQFSFTITYIAA